MALTASLLIRREQIAEETFEIGIQTGERYPFFPGQHADCFLIDSSGRIDCDLSRTFSFCSLPNEKEIIFVFRKTNSPFKKTLLGMPLQSGLALSRATGYFGQSVTDVPTLFIAGGVGIAPFMSLLFSQPLRETPICLLSVNASQARSPYQDKLTRANSVIPWFTYQTFLTRTEDNALQNDNEKFYDILHQAQSFEDFYISGPTGFVDQCRSILTEYRITDSQIKVEDFGLMQLES